MTTPDAASWAPSGRPDLRTFVPRERRTVPLLLWLGCLAAALVLLLWLGDGRLAAPDLTQPSTWGAWAQERGTAEAVVAVLRIVALGLAWYLVGVTFVAVLAHALRAARLVRLADALSFGPVRTVVQQALGVGLAVGVVASALPPTALGGDAPRPTAAAAGTVEAVPLAIATPDDALDGGSTSLPDGAGAAMPAAAGGATPARRAEPPVPGPRLAATPLPDAASDGSTTTASDGSTTTASDGSTTPASNGSTATASDADDAVHVDGPDAGTGTTRRDAATTDTTGSVHRAGPSGTSSEPREVRVRPGDHLWGIAETDLRDSVDRQPSEAEVLAHWQRVIEANADRLVVPTNPDLLRPGQLVLLPDVEVSP